MHQLSTLRVARHDDFGARTLRLRLHDQLRHERRASRVAALEEAQDRGAVVDALDGEVGGADVVGEGLEEGRAREGADVAVLAGAAGEDEGYGAAGCAVCELVFGLNAGVLSLYSEGGSEGEGEEREEGEGGLHGCGWGEEQVGLVDGGLESLAVDLSLCTKCEWAILYVFLLSLRSKKPRRLHR